MIDYKLAKQLKEAGFIFKQKVWEVDDFPPESYKLPTLSELIEACGDEFAELAHPTKDWFAESKTNELKDVCKTCGVRTVEPIMQHGKAPEVAVAKLWLKLNERNRK